jgi:hypothetical protein
MSNYLRSASIDDETASLEHRVHSYLDSNCSHCHRPGAEAGRATFDARLTTPMALTGLIGGAPLAGELGLSAPEIVRPGDPVNSVLWHRDGSVDPVDQMPPVGKSLQHAEYMEVLTAWIDRLGFANFDAAMTAAGVIGGVHDDDDGDGLTNGYEFLVGLDPAVRNAEDGTTWSEAGGEVEVTMALEGDALADGLTPAVMDSVDLKTWFDAGTPGSILTLEENTAGNGVDGVMRWRFTSGTEGFLKVGAATGP